ncbi:HsdR family type I site-specific deoxyribonuclease [Candidatus Woesearchaeota archaeon]|nr:HsdR family type I site-specific deoxyribonuclease [Candidatus Woesearchaeota archaeon]
MELLGKQGWNIIISENDDNKFLPNLTLRKDFNGVLIESRLKESLQKLNDWLDDEQIEEVYQEINRIGLRKGLITANQDFWELLLEPPAKKNKNIANSKPEAIKIINFDEPTNNDFLAMNQFRINTPGTLRDYIVPDIVLFINGIPLGVIECKYPTQVDVEAMEEAITQLKRYSNTREDVHEKEGNERLFHYNQIMIATTNDEARMGSITSEYDHYLEWKDTYPFKLNTKWSSQEKLIQGSLTKEGVTNIIRNFILYDETEKGKIKIVGRYHQYRAVNKVIDRLQNEKTPDDRSGIVWHTQGSGKSMSMVFLIKKLRTIESLKRFKVVIVTDRTDLEGQLKDTAGLAEKPYVMRNTKALTAELKTDTSNLVMVMAQKFLKRTQRKKTDEELPDYEEFPIFNNSENVLVLVDEAHRTQSGVFGDNLVISLPKSTRIAFTGTPLIAKKVKKRTYERFGKYIDKYRMKESIADGSTLRIKYEGKTVRSRIKSKEKMDVAFEDMFEDKTKEELIEIKKKYGTKGNVLESEKRIKAISKDIVKHYFENIFDNGFKAQIVASSRIAAVRYKNAIDESLKEYIKEYADRSFSDPERVKRMKFITSVCRITWKNNDKPETIRFAKDAVTKLGEENINFKSKYDLKKPNTSIGFLIVKDMLLTGFDAPIEQVMYLDKRMTDHTLLQAIARVNRVTKGKDVGYIVDYYGVTNHLKEALESYSADDLQLDDVFTNVSTELPILKHRYEQLIKFFKDKKITKIEDYVNYKIKAVNEQLNIMESCLDALEDVKTRADFNVKFKLFLKSMDILLSKPISRPYIPALKAFGHIHKRAQSRFRDDSINILGAGRKVRQLIDDYLVSVGINTKIKPVDITSDNFEEEVNKNRSMRAQASEMEHAIRKHCKVMLNSDPVYYKKISEKLEEILKRFKTNWDEQVKLIKHLRKDIKTQSKLREADKGYGIYMPYYELIEYNIQEKFEKDEKIRLKKAIVSIVNIIRSESEKVDFWTNPHKIKKLKAEIDDVLLNLNNSQIYNIKEKLVNDLVKLARNRSK